MAFVQKQLKICEPKKIKRLLDRVYVWQPYLAQTPPNLPLWNKVRDKNKIKVHKDDDKSWSLWEGKNDT